MAQEGSGEVTKGGSLVSEKLRGDERKWRGRREHMSVSLAAKTSSAEFFFSLSLEFSFSHFSIASSVFLSVFASCFGEIY